MTGIDGRAYPLPSYDTIVSRLAEQKELLRTKADQGFNKLLLVPFGMSLDAMIVKFKAYLLKYKMDYDEEHKNDIPPVTFDLNKNQPVGVRDQGYNEADTNGKLVYDPISFNADHNGKTKIEILAGQQTTNDICAGWRVLLLQSGENTRGCKGIPRSGKGASQGLLTPRQDIEARKSPRDYLTDLLATSTDENSPYRGEFGMCLEEWITAFLTNLEETGKPMDDYNNGEDSIAYLTGAYFTISDSVQRALWDSQARLLADGPGDVYDHTGTRSAVRV